MKKVFSLFGLLIGLFASAGGAHAFFTDVDSSDPHFEAINYLEKLGVLQGYEDGTFQSKQPINRVEALKIILEGSKIEIEPGVSQTSFNDVTSDAWYASYVETAKSLGIVKGDDSTGLFRPESILNEAENLKILLEANKRNVEPTSSNPYPNVPADAWFAGYFDYAKKLSLFQNIPVEPTLPITRGMMAELMYQLSMKPEGYEEGQASFYGLALQGNGTASGERFDAYALTAAHKTLPFGTMLRVKNLDNGKQVDVKVNDRGPYVSGRIIDLSQSAFEAIAPLSQGVAHVSIVPIDALEPDLSTISCGDRDSLEMISKDRFENISLSQDFPNRFTDNETWSFTGQTSSKEGKVTAFLVDQNGVQMPFYGETDVDGNFSVSVFFPRPGTYQFGLLAGTSGTGSAVEIKVVSHLCLDEGLNNDLPTPASIKTDLSAGNTVLNWTLDDYNIHKITFSQGERHKEYITYKQDAFVPHYADFLGWQSGEVEVQLQGANLTGASALGAEQIAWSTPSKATMTVTDHHLYSINTEEVSPKALPQTLTANQNLSIKFDPKANINEDGLVILPDGTVNSDTLSSQTHNAFVNVYGVRVFPSSADELEFSFTPKSNETHIVEINDEEGEAVINIPIYPKGFYPLIPNPIDLSGSGQFELTIGQNLFRTQMLSLVNEDRRGLGLSGLKLDQSLSELAQMKADDMAKRAYLSHWNPEGLTVNELRKDFNIKQYVSENIALDNSPQLAQYGLMSSALHRINLINPEWKRAGFAYAKNPDGGYLFVQIFSDEPVDFSNLDDLRARTLKVVNEGRGAELAMNDTLNNLSQTWSQTMVDEDFFALTSPKNVKYVDQVHTAGITAALGTYLVGNSSLEAALEQISGNTQLKDSRWKDIGIGIAQDNLGIIKITLTYTE